MGKENLDNLDENSIFANGEMTDFDEDFAITEEDIAKLREETAKEVSEFDNIQIIDDEENLEDLEEPDSDEEEENQDAEGESDEQELSCWEELDKNKAVIKKYIFSAPKELFPILDSMTIKERNVFINSALRLKIEQNDASKQKMLKMKIFTHIIIMILIFIFSTPILIYATNQAFVLTFKNYKYSQDNFEKLYKERFMKNNAYLRSKDYNKKHEEKK